MRYKLGGVFDDIGYLSRGDAIEVEGSHSTLTYRVQSIAVLSKDDVARNAEQILDQTGAGRMVVITCGGASDGTAWRSTLQRDHRGARLPLRVQSRGRMQACAVFERAAGFANDLGLPSRGRYDPGTG